MTLTGDSRAQFSELDQLELADYRPLNRFAIVALILGCVSPVSLVHPALGLLPLFACVAAVMALRQVRTSELKQSGRGLAIIGLYLSVLFGSWTGIHYATRSAKLYNQAREFAEQWFDLLRNGRLYEAHQLVAREGERVAPGASLERHYSERTSEDMQKMRAEMLARANSSGGEGDVDLEGIMGPAPHDEFHRYFSEPLQRRLKNMGRDARVEFRERVQMLALGAHELAIDLLFEVSPAGGEPSFPVLITIQRTFPPGLTADWHVAGVRDPNTR